MPKKILFLIADGIGDRPIPQFSYKTPLEAANTPHLNKLASEGITGLMHTLDRGLRPGSDVAHLSLFGYPLEKSYSGRGVFEVLGMGMQLQKGDVCFRGNLCTVEKGVITDRRAGRIESKEIIPQDMTVKIEDVTFIMTPGVLHRVAVIMRGPGLTCNIFDVDPHENGLAPRFDIAKNDSEASQKTQRVIEQFLKHMQTFLSEHSETIKRKEQNDPYANFLNLRGAGEFIDVPSFKEKYELSSCCIAGAGLYKGLATYVGMDIIEVEGASGKIDTNLANKIDSAITQLQTHDFVFVHMKFADSLGEVNDYEGKRDFIERIDESLKPLLSLKDVIVFVCGDHSTPCTLKAHSGDPVPAIIWGPPECILTDTVQFYGERSTQTGGLGHFFAKDVINELLNLAGRQHLIGA